jgi:hypothetical protein
MVAALLSCPCQSLATDELTIDDADVRKATNALLTFLTFSVIPDSTADALQIDSRAGDDPNVLLSQLGGDFTLSGALPIYLEGYLGWAEYDPDFVISGGEQQGKLETTWRTFSATGGIGYDFPIAEEWVIRPVVNISLARMTSDAALVGQISDSQLSAADLEAKSWLDSGWLTAGGLGGSLILDFERKREDYEAEVELRYRHYYVTSLDSSKSAIEGSTNADTFGMWARLRFPTGYTALDRPVRLVLEGAHTWFAPNQADILGFNHLSKVGMGIELDLGARNKIVERVRVIGRYVFGEDISGVSLGFGASF